jgi:glycosyltransferase involved in cell wall biosynthesis
VLVISNGFSKFHLAVAAAEAHRRGILASFITGAYPSSVVQRWVGRSGLARNRKAARLLDRRGAIPDDLVHALWIPEAVNVLAMTLKRKAATAAIQLNAWSFRHYGWLAVKHVRIAAERGARIYHYRSGFGLDSAREARRLGMVTLCDHSIVHPARLEALVAGPERLKPVAQQTRTARLPAEVLEDIEQADAVLVNSDFVRQTFLDAGHDGKPVHVLYLGVDDEFLNAVPHRAEAQSCSGPLRMLFAGGFERRKGADTVLNALELVRGLPCTLEIAGTVDLSYRDTCRLEDDPRVLLLGWLPRRELAKRMAAAEVFIFPSLAEGSARVVFEALAAGCYVITTSNAGSIVEDGVHGRLITPGDAQQLAAAIRNAVTDRNELAAIGRSNAALVRARYHQRNYGNALAALYKDLLRSGAAKQMA